MLTQHQYGMKMLVVTKSLKILFNAFTITAIIIAQLSLFSNSSTNSITHPTFLERLHNCIMFHSPRIFINPYSKMVPAKLVTLCVILYILTSKMTTFRHQNSVVFMAPIQFFTLASRSHHIAICV